MMRLAPVRRAWLDAFAGAKERNVPQLQVVEIETPIPRTFISKSSPCCQGMFPIPVAAGRGRQLNAIAKRGMRRTVAGDVDDHRSEDDGTVARVETDAVVGKLAASVEREEVERHRCED